MIGADIRIFSFQHLCIGKTGMISEQPIVGEELYYKPWGGQHLVSKGQSITEVYLE